jgi:SsrA-binding protein
MAKKQPKKQPEGIRQIARNRRAFHDFEVLEQVEAGLVLLGSEVKSLRQGSVSFNDSYARHRKGEMWLLELHIAPYVNASWINHEPTRKRKLLLHKREIRTLATRCDRQGLTLVPLELYFKKGKAKLMLGVCKGRKKHDKRQALRKKQDQRAMQRYEH